ncbi:uncharacterized protein [Elaeis guineensis]|uniref:uncharacterized protein n=1 Tax=Elaeis guineensis var. tenera TaxID=51953 RepID=UPI003C6D02DE
MNDGNDPSVFKLSGQNYHMIGSLLPTPESSPKFAQLYIYDTQNEVLNRMKTMSGSNSLHTEIITDLKEMLDNYNVLIKSFRMVKDKFQEEDYTNVKLRLIEKMGSDEKRYNLPTTSEVAAPIVGDFESSAGNRDTTVETQSGLLKRITELNPSYLALQYPLLFPHGKDGYNENIQFRDFGWWFL